METTQPEKDKKTLYDTSYRSIFARNFLAGFSHALGAIFLYLIVVAIFYYVVATFLMPRLRTLIPSALPFPNPGITDTETGGVNSGITPQQLQEIMQGTRQNELQPTP